MTLSLLYYPYKLPQILWGNQERYHKQISLLSIISLSIIYFYLYIYLYIFILALSGYQCLQSSPSGSIQVAAKDRNPFF